MKSMTGYGRGVATKDKRTVTVELKSVNGRFLEVNAKLPKSLMYIDDVVQKRIRSVISRGSVDVYFSYENLSDSAKKVNVDSALAAQYVSAAKNLRAEFRLEDDFNVTALLRTPDIISVSVPEDDRDTVAELAAKAADDALKMLDGMRRTEGKAVQSDLSALVGNLKPS